MRLTEDVLKKGTSHRLKKSIPGIKRAAFAFIVAALFAGCAGCSQCAISESEAPVIRTPEDVSNFSVLYVDGEATLHWVNPADEFLDHIEVTLDPGGEPLIVAKDTEKLIIPNLTPEQMYNFTLKTVDQWQNKSEGGLASTGKGYKQLRPADIPPESVAGIKGTPIAHQVTLSWSNIDEAEYDHVEITFDPSSETLIRVIKGIESKTVLSLVNSLEHTFYVAAVDAEGGRKPVQDVGIFISNIETAPEAVLVRPKDGQVTLSWTDPKDPELDHIEVVYNSYGEEPVIVPNIPRGAQTRTITDLSNQKDYEFTVYAADTQGYRRPLAGVSPNPPAINEEGTEIRGRPVSSQIRLDWTDPAIAELDHIEIMYNHSGGLSRPVSIPKGIGTSTFTGLSDNSEYSFYLYGVDTQGNRRAVQNVTLSTPALHALTTRPVSGRATVLWNDPDDPKLDHIELNYSPDGGEPVSVGKGEESHTFTNLLDEKEYTFTVTAVTTENDSYAVAVADTIVPELTILKARPANGKLALSWEDTLNNNSPDITIDHIEILYSPGGETVLYIAKGVEHQEFSDLPDGVEHTFTISAADTAGNRYPVPSAAFVIPEPEQSLTLITIKPADGKLSLLWKDPVDINLDHIGVQYSPDGETVRHIAKGEGKQDFTGLVDGTEYTFIIYAMDTAGRKYPVPTAEFVIPIADPGTLGPLDWKPIGDSTFGENTIMTLSYGTGISGARWVAGGMEGRIAYSADNGLTWTAVPDSTFNAHTVNAITYANGRWIAVGKGGKIAYSTNAAGWTAVNHNLFTVDGVINAVAYNNGRWIAGGSNGTIIISDDNGDSWRQVGDSAFGDSIINTIASSGDRWIAGGTDGKIAYSTDNGNTWIAAANSTFGTAAINIIIFDKGRWVAGGYGQRLAYSTDSVTWQPLIRPFYVLGMGYNSGRWVAGGQEGRIAWSVDLGEHWTNDAAGRGLFGESWVQTAVFGAGGGGRWIAGGQFGKLIYADGL